MRQTLAARLSTALLIVVAAVGSATLLAPTVLRDPPAYAGNAIGTWAVALFIAAPIVAVAMRVAARGSLVARIVWLGGVGYLLYQAILSSFSLQFNPLFLLYVASLSLGVCTFFAVLATIDVRELAGRVRQRFPARLVGGYLIATAVAFAALWLADLVPAMVSGSRPLSLRGTTLPTNPVQVIDFAFTLPASFIGGLWLWRRRPWGYLIGGTMLVLLLIESVSIAVDQYAGHRADPTQPAGTVALFLLLTAIGAVPTVTFLRALGSRGPVSRGVAAGV